MGTETGTSGESITLTGTITKGEVLTGSKSEHVGPILRSDDGTEYRLFLIGDNPFQNESTDSLIGQRVTLSGVWRNGVVRVAPADLSVVAAAHHAVEPEAQPPTPDQDGPEPHDG